MPKSKSPASRPHSAARTARAKKSSTGAKPETEGSSSPAYSPLASRSQDEAVALGRRVGEIVRAGDCTGGERMAREAGDLALVRAVQEHCRRPR